VVPESFIFFYAIVHLSYGLFCFYANMSLKSLDYKFIYSPANGGHQETGDSVPSNEDDGKKETPGCKKAWESLSFPSYPLEFIIELLDGETYIKEIHVSLQRPNLPKKIEIFSSRGEPLTDSTEFTRIGYWVIEVLNVGTIH
jgi:hypothetical protein